MTSGADDGVDVMTDTELEAYARRLATDNETLRRQLEFAQRDAEYADDLRDLVRGLRRHVDEVHGHGADTLEGEIDRLRMIISRIGAAISGVRND